MNRLLELLIKSNFNLRRMQRGVAILKLNYTYIFKKGKFMKNYLLLY